MPEETPPSAGERILRSIENAQAELRGDAAEAVRPPEGGIEVIAGPLTPPQRSQSASKTDAQTTDDNPLAAMAREDADLISRETVDSIRALRRENDRYLRLYKATAIALCKLRDIPPFDAFPGTNLPNWHVIGDEAAATELPEPDNGC